MADVSVIILSFNERQHIERCLRSLAPFAAHVFVIDCHSTDGTIEAARALGATVVQRDWPNNHAIQFNWALEHLPLATSWVMRMDADEYVTPELADEIGRVLPTLGADVSGVNLRRRVYFMNRWIRHGGYYPTILLRLFRRGQGRSEQRLMDEHLRVTAGRTVTFAHDIVDHNLNDLTWWTDKHNKYATREAIAMLIERRQYRDARARPERFAASTRQAERKRWLKHNVYLRLPMTVRALAYFAFRYVVLLGFLDGKPGLIWHTLQGFWYRFLVDVKQMQFEQAIRDDGATVEQIASRYGIRVTDDPPAGGPAPTRGVIARFDARIVTPAGEPRSAPYDAAMDVLLITIGSHGDVHPFVGIGRTLAARGHRVRVATNAYFGDLVTRAGLAFEPLGDVETFDRWIADPLVWHPHKGPGRILRGVSETLDQVHDFTAEHAGPETVVVGSSLALGALVAAEARGLRYATAHLGPICVRSRVTLPTLPGGVNLTRMPAWFKRRFWDGGDKWFIDPAIAPALNALRARVGLAPVEHVLDWWNAPQLTLGLWPDWFSPAPPDAPPQLRLTGFPQYDEADHHVLDAGLDAWLAAGDAPVAFTPGSAMKHGHAFFASAAEACARLGRRGLLLTRHAEQVPARLPPGVRHATFAPFGALLPRCAALVHHGGIGTTAQALAAGVPQLIMAMAHDQPDNAAHVKRLGCGDAIARAFFWPSRVARKLERLTESPAVRAACADVARRFDGVDPLGETATLIEALGAQAATTATASPAA